MSNSPGPSSSKDSMTELKKLDPDQEKMVDEFVRVTEADASVARFYLDQHNWQVVQAINEYFEHLHEQYANDSDPDDEQSEPVSKKAKTDENSEDKLSQDGGDQPKLFRHITWNIDSLNNKNLKIRVQAICDYIVKEKATFVFLQEVIRESELIIRDKLSDRFSILSGFDHTTDYYTITLVRKEKSIRVKDNEIVHFRQTIMGRNILKTNVSIGDANLLLLNTHLESTKDGEANRVQQLSFLLRYFANTENSTSILAAGDLNLRDKELAGVGGLPPGTQDAWIATGRRKEVEFTWDTLRNDNLEFQPTSKSRFKPRMRFDRVFFRKSLPVHIDLVHFGLIGLERLKPYVCFPSDHWGVITSYQLYRTTD